MVSDSGNGWAVPGSGQVEGFSRAEGVASAAPSKVVVFFFFPAMREQVALGGGESGRS